MPKINNEYKQDIKTILLGSSGVGKTCLINSLIGVEFNEHTVSTISTTYVLKYYNINSNKYQVNLWDTAGQERYRQLTKLYFIKVLI